MPPAFAQLPASITDMTAVELGGAIRSRQVSCREVMDAYLARIEAVNPTVNAIVSLQDRATRCWPRPTRATPSSPAGSGAGRMHGFPQAAKDLAATAGIRYDPGLADPRGTSCRKADAIIVERARSGRRDPHRQDQHAGVRPGLAHLQHGLRHHAQRLRPDALSAGGSSGGAAVALATAHAAGGRRQRHDGLAAQPGGLEQRRRLPPLARPRALRPDRRGLHPAARHRGADGPHRRRLRAAALRAGRLRPARAALDRRGPLGLRRIARRATSAARASAGSATSAGYLPMEAGVLDVCRDGLKHFEAIGCTVEEVTPDFDMSPLWDAWLVLRGTLVAGAAGAALCRPGQARAAEARGDLGGRERPQAVRLRGLPRSSARSAWYQAMRGCSRRYDFLALPTAQVFPFDATLHWPDHDRRAEDGHLPPLDGGGDPRHPRRRSGPRRFPPASTPAACPMGLQILGPAQADLSTLQIGQAYEQAAGFASLRPAAAT